MAKKEGTFIYKHDKISFRNAILLSKNAEGFLKAMSTKSATRLTEKSGIDYKPVHSPITKRERYLVVTKEENARFKEAATGEAAKEMRRLKRNGGGLK